MTEAEWLACEDPIPILRAGQLDPQSRKFGLLIAAALRRVWDHLPDNLRGWGDEVEAEADGRPAAEAPWVEVDRELDSLDWNEAGPGVAGRFGTIVRLIYQYTGPAPAQVASSWRREKAAQVGIVRDIFGNPFRPVIADPSWRTSTAIALASQMYESRDFSAMPILADALQDAGCDNADVLNHCRDPKATHVRGCWVVDLVLGKA